jgi:hypothetical protein
MSWYRSLLVAETKPAAVTHYFQCPNCNRVTETKTGTGKNGDRMDPSKLSRPVERFFCAA